MKLITTVAHSIAMNIDEFTRLQDILARVLAFENSDGSSLLSVSDQVFVESLDSLIRNEIMR